MDELNKQQREAVETNDGPLLIIAGPGAGKTKILTMRIAYLLASGHAKPSEILTLTFINKAAAEMRNRVARVVADKPPLITTFHALCYQLLGQGTEHRIQFISEHERTMIIKQLRKSAELKTISAHELALKISRLKNRPPQEAIDDQSLSSLLTAYNQTLAERNLYDFDDLLQKRITKHGQGTLFSL